jgi:16S rRNA (guanine527-N7)-methyltransferase
VFHVKTSTISSAVVEELELLGARYGLSAHERDQLRAILGCLAEQDEAPTTIRDPASSIHTHLADSLVALDLAVLRSASSIADLGAGAGFPGLPLAVALPGSKVRLVESQRRKCAFIQRVCQAATIANACAVCMRAEEWADGIGTHDVVLARALAPPPVVLEYAAPLLRMEGTLVDWRGHRNAGEDSMALLAAAELGLQRVAIEHVDPYPGARAHHLHLYVKTAPTPDRFPRRAGVARKRPLGC